MSPATPPSERVALVSWDRPLVSAVAVEAKVIPFNATESVVTPPDSPTVTEPAQDF